MKKVILSAYACSPIRGSEPGNGWSWAVNVAMNSYEVWCITNNEDKDIITEELQRLNLENLHFVFISVPYGLDRKLLDTSSKKIYLHYLLWRRKAAKISVELHNKFHFDIGHHVTFGSLQQGTFLWKLSNIKLIFGPVGGGQVAPAAFKEYFGSAWKIEELRNRISALSFLFNSDLRNTLKKASHVLVTNVDTENLIKKTDFYSPKKVHFLLDNAVPDKMLNSPYRNRTYGNQLQLLWVGRMLPRKGIKLILHALSFVPAYVNYRLTIVGGGEQFESLEEWIDEYKLDREKLSILGQVPFEEVIEHYQTSEAFIFCSLRDSCPAQLNEAMAFGLPPIVLNIHGSALAVPDNCGIKVEVSTPIETAMRIANSIELLYKDKNQLADFSSNSYLYSRTNTWTAKVHKVTSLYYES